MAPTLKKQRAKKNNWDLKNLLNFVGNCMTQCDKIWILGAVMMCFELVLNVAIIFAVKYTEIDWKAYMDEVEGFLNGTLDYTKLKGDTGPLVYPAGFVYIFSGLYYLTNHGANIKVAQCIFCLFYLVNLALVIRIYKKSCTTPPYVLIFICCMSYRVHSIYVLRLFNDPVAMIFLYAAVNLFIDKHWTLGCVLFSLGVSIKMNILLFAPGLFVILMHENGMLKTAANLLICFFIQVLLGLPFLLENPKGYLIMSFDLGRQFFYIWTVNWRCIPEDLFLNKQFQMGLLLLHLSGLLIFASKKWMNDFKSLIGLVNPFKRWHTGYGDLNPTKIITILFVSNFIGMCFSRSLHYQFYVWYYHTLPVILWTLPISTKIRLLILGLIEMSWNTYPSTVLSSSILHASHAAILCLLWFSDVWKVNPAKIKSQ